MHASRETWQGRQRILGPEDPDTLKAQELYAQALQDGGHAAEAEPIERESALECSRVVADLLETLGQFIPAEARNAATLRGKLVSNAAPGLESLPAKVVLEGAEARQQVTACLEHTV